ncbi:MAG: right-handed parallel beta-helix repeat-containing protein [Candidatus Bathyarchaeia archaeon]
MARGYLFSIALICVLVLLSPCLLKKAYATDGFPVHNISTDLNYATIQSAINAIQTVDGNTIRVDAGTYNETLTIDKGVSVIGDSPSTTTINGQVTIISSGVEIFNFTLNGGIKIFSSYYATSRCTVSNNTIVGVPNIGDGYGIHVYTNEAGFADYGIIENNEIRDFNYTGISIYRVSGWTISGNDIHDNLRGGIYLGDGESCNIIGNSIHNDNSIYPYTFFALELEYSSNNVIYYNDFFDNGKFSQVYVSNGYSNKWDSGSQGNYWDDYKGVDSGNGIGSTPYLIDSYNQDNFPLMHTYNIPEFPSFIVLTISMLVTLLAVIVYLKLIKQRFQGLHRSFSS